MYRCVYICGTGPPPTGLISSNFKGDLTLTTSLLVPDGDKAMISVLTYGMFGFVFVFAVVEAWELTREPPQDVLVDTIVTLVMRGFNAIGGPPVAATAGSA